MDWNIQLCELNYDHEEAMAVQEVLRREWLTMGEESDRFEKEFTELIRHKNQGVFVSSATAGLHLVLMALGIKEGDEVIIPGLTFVSDANVIVQMGGVPVFADSNSIKDLNVSTTSVIENIGPKTKAIVIVHFAGFPKQLTELYKICQDRGITLIEDCAHAPGAHIGHAMCGNMADFSFFSFFSNKNIATGEGGMVFARSSHKAKLIRSMRSHGMSAPTLERHKGRAISYDVQVTGLNYRADELRAAIGRVQLKKLLTANAQRKKIYERYSANLRNSEIVVPFTHFCDCGSSSYHIMPIVLPKSSDRISIINVLQEKGIQTSIHYPNFKNFTAYRSIASSSVLPVVDEICERELTLPLHPRMTAADCDYVSSTLLEAI
ncbi:DegT/DnrJ/EryC1/StrS family aminotransferase [Planktomarina temperata]|nr:DegT/DnrJ/EryC1/StrS family aminotransferase [Planktomarina temperata]